MSKEAIIANVKVTGRVLSYAVYRDYTLAKIQFDFDDGQTVVVDRVVRDEIHDTVSKYLPFDQGEESTFEVFVPLDFTGAPCDD